MSEKTIRTGSGADHRRSSTDWSRVSALSEAEIDDAIAADPDAYPLESEVLGRTSSSYHYKLFKDSAGKYRWSLIGVNGKVIAQSHENYASKTSARKAISGLRDALLGGKSMAA